MSYSFAIDRGGTFTDVFAKLPSGQTLFELSSTPSGRPVASNHAHFDPFLGETKVLKLLSVNPEYPDAPREVIRRILGSRAGQPIDHSRKVLQKY